MNHYVDPLMNFKQSSSVYLLGDRNSKDAVDVVERNGLRVRYTRTHTICSTANTHLYSERQTPPRPFSRSENRSPPLPKSGVIHKRTYDGVAGREKRVKSTIMHRATYIAAFNAVPARVVNCSSPRSRLYCSCVRYTCFTVAILHKTAEGSVALTAVVAYHPRNSKLWRPTRRDDRPINSMRTDLLAAAVVIITRRECRRRKRVARRVRPLRIIINPAETGTAVARTGSE